MTWWQASIREVADALTEPSIHREPIPEWDRHRNRKIAGYHRVVLPGLLAQLHQSVYPVMSSASEGMPAGGKPKSRPPLALEALTIHDNISYAVTAWCQRLGLPVRPDVSSNLRQLAAKAMSFDEPTAQILLAELTRWRRWCLVATGWEHLRILRTPCPATPCPGMATIRINLTAGSAMCRECGTTWQADDGTIHQLIAHVTGSATTALRHQQAS